MRWVLLCWGMLPALKFLMLTVGTDKIFLLVNCFQGKVVCCGELRFLKKIVCRDILIGKCPDGRCITSNSLDTKDSNLKMSSRDQGSLPFNLQMVGKYIETLLVNHSFTHSFILTFNEHLLWVFCTLNVWGIWLHKAKYLSLLLRILTFGGRVVD